MSCISYDMEGYEMSKATQAVNNVMSKMAKSIEKKYHMRPSGSCISMPDGNVRKLGFDYKIQGPLSREEIRKLLLGIGQEFLTIINSDEAIKPFLTKYPFEIENIQSIIFFIDSKGYNLNEPYIGIGEIARHKLFYAILIEKNNIPVTVNEFEESYEDALKAVQESDKIVE